MNESFIINKLCKNKIYCILLIIVFFIIITVFSFSTGFIIGSVEEQKTIISHINKINTAMYYLQTKTKVLKTQDDYFSLVDLPLAGYKDNEVTYYIGTSSGIEVTINNSNSIISIRASD